MKTAIFFLMVLAAFSWRTSTALQRRSLAALSPASPGAQRPYSAPDVSQPIRSSHTVEVLGGEHKLFLHKAPHTTRRFLHAMSGSPACGPPIAPADGLDQTSACSSLTEQTLEFLHSCEVFAAHVEEVQKTFPDFLQLENGAEPMLGGKKLTFLFMFQKISNLQLEFRRVGWKIVERETELLNNMRCLLRKRDCVARRLVGLSWGRVRESRIAEEESLEGAESEEEEGGSSFALIRGFTGLGSEEEEGSSFGFALWDALWDFFPSKISIEGSCLTGAGRFSGQHHSQEQEVRDCEIEGCGLTGAGRFSGQHQRDGGWKKTLAKLLPEIAAPDCSAPATPASQLAPASFRREVDRSTPEQLLQLLHTIRRALLRNSARQNLWRKRAVEHGSVGEVIEQLRCAVDAAWWNCDAGTRLGGCENFLATFLREGADIGWDELVLRSTV